jgi:quercetin dioxygenase-like cupin family protein
MPAVAPQPDDFSEAWIEGDAAARWRSATGHGRPHGALTSGSSLLEVPAGCRLPRHTDSAEETIVIVSGRADVTVGDERTEVPAGGVALVPADVPHEVRNAGEVTLRFAAVYADVDVATRYEAGVEPDGSPERRPVP